MIHDDTVFILGAGASVPYGYPTGVELRKYLCTEFNDYFPAILNRIRLGGQRSQWEAKAKHLSKAFYDSTTPSIDLFLARNQHLSDIGRIAIMLSIFDYERKSNFREDSPKPDQDWYKDLFHSMTKTLIAPDSYKDFGNNRMTFITFNYDRSLEHFFYESFKNSFSEVQEGEIITEIKKIPIHHVYGKAQSLPWEDKNNFEAIDYMTEENDNSPYERFSIERLQEWSSNIRLIHDREKHDALYLGELSLKIEKAKRIFFLGFGYAQENLEILDLPRILTENYHIYGTAYRSLPKEIHDIRINLSNNFKHDSRIAVKPKQPNPRIENMDCVTLLRNYL